MSFNKTKIEWCDFTWNPLVGCKHHCYFCYAERINNRFHIIPDFNEPQFFPERLDEICPKMPKERNEITRLISPDKPIIFVVSMGDLFGSWVDTDWIYKVIKYAKNNPQCIFMFLTKNALGYNGFVFPDNCILGITLTKGVTEKDRDTLFDFVYYSNGRRFISIEPIMGGFEGVKFDGIDFVIVGAMTGPGSIIPKKKWITSINHHTIYYKNNILKHIAHV